MVVRKGNVGMGWTQEQCSHVWCSQSLHLKKAMPCGLPADISFPLLFLILIWFWGQTQQYSGSVPGSVLLLTQFSEDYMAPGVKPRLLAYKTCTHLIELSLSSNLFLSQ